MIRVEITNQPSLLEIYVARAFEHAREASDELDQITQIFERHVDQEGQSKIVDLWALLDVGDLFAEAFRTAANTAAKILATAAERRLPSGAPEATAEAKKLTFAADRIRGVMRISLRVEDHLRAGVFAEKLRAAGPSSGRDVLKPDGDEFRIEIGDQWHRQLSVLSVDALTAAERFMKVENDPLEESPTDAAAEALARLKPLLADRRPTDPEALGAARKLWCEASRKLQDMRQLDDVDECFAEALEARVKDLEALITSIERALKLSAAVQTADKLRGLAEPKT